MTGTVALQTSLAVFGLDLIGWVAIGLALLGLVGSALPLVPGAGLTLGGVYLYWWHTGFTDPSLLVLGLLTLLGLFVMAIDWLGGAVAAKASGASTISTAVAGITGFVLLFPVGPIGLFLGVATAVFIAEYRTGVDARTSAKRALLTTVAMLANTLAQVVLTAILVVGFLLAVAF